MKETHYCCNTVLLLYCHCCSYYCYCYNCYYYIHYYY